MAIKKQGTRIISDHNIRSADLEVSLWLSPTPKCGTESNTRCETNARGKTSAGCFIVSAKIAPVAAWLKPVKLNLALLKFAAAWGIQYTQDLD